MADWPCALLNTIKMDLLKYSAELSRRGLKPHAGCTADVLVELEVELAAALLPELRTLYLNQDGTEPTHRFSYRQMTVDEVIKVEQFTKQFEVKEDRVPGGFPYREWKLRTFWTDDNSNYAAVFLQGPLKGIIVFWGINEREMYPSFRTMEQFYRRLIATFASGEIANLPWVDYPAPAPSPTEDLLSFDRNRVAELKSSLLTLSEDRATTAGSEYMEACLAVMTPWEDTNDLFPLLDEGTGNAQEAVCRTLSIRPLEDVVSPSDTDKWYKRLSAIVLGEGCRGGGNLQTSALQAINLCREHRTCLFRLAPYVAPQLTSLMAKSLQRICTVERRGDEWWYNPNASLQWHRIGGKYVAPY